VLGRCWRGCSLVGKLRGVDWLALEVPSGKPEYGGLQLVLNGRVIAEHVDYHG